jgi:hypothetical protein
MKRWFRFEIIYQKVNPFSFEKKTKLYSNYQSVFSENIKDAEQQAVKFFCVEKTIDKLISIRCIND